MASPSEIRSLLLGWYERQQRTLPWRETRDPWAILVSEVMLQQTRVEVVVPYYLRFMERFPDARALAQADEADYLACWAGLGYYRRVRNLAKAAQVIRDQHGGRFPKELEAIRALPGVGRYTAGAVASIALGLAQPVVDGNVARVFSRLFQVEGDVRSSATSRRLWGLAEDLLDRTRPGDFNQALMELGALVCLPRTPTCLLCPLTRQCEARSNGVVGDYPNKTARRAAIPVRLAAVLVREGNSIGLVRRRRGGLMEGLFDLPSVELPQGTDPVGALRSLLKQRFGLHVRGVERLGESRHTITHHNIAAEVFGASLARRGAASLLREKPEGEECDSPDHQGHRIAADADASGIRFVTSVELGSLGLSSLARKMLDLLDLADLAD